MLGLAQVLWRDPSRSMTATRVVALWAALSVPIALVLAMVIRATAERELPDQVDRYLRRLTASRRARVLRQAVRVATVTTVIGMVTVASLPLVADVPGRIIVAALGHRDLLGDAPVGGQAVVDPDASAQPAPPSHATASGQRLEASPDDEAALAGVPTVGEATEGAATLGDEPGASEVAAPPSDEPAQDDPPAAGTGANDDQYPAVGPPSPQPADVPPAEPPPAETTTTTTTTSTTTTTTAPPEETTTTTTTTVPPDETTTTTTTAPPDETTTTTTTAPPDGG